MQWFGSKEEAIDAGEEEKNLVTLHYRNEEEKAALELAAAHGNREYRRMPARRKFAPQNPLHGGDLTEVERNRRNAARRVARKQRKINRKKK